MKNLIKQLPVGLTLAGKTHKEFEIREPLVDDMVEAEKDADPRQIHSFNVALLSRIIVRMGDFDGIVTASMLKKMKRADYNAMIMAMLEIEDMGEDQSGVEEASTTTS